MHCDYVVLCRGDLNLENLEVFGVFETEIEANTWIHDSDPFCPNPHEVRKVHPAAGVSAE